MYIDVFGVLWFRPSCVADLWKDWLTLAGVFAFLAFLRLFPRLVLASAGISNAGYEFEVYQTGSYSGTAGISSRDCSGCHQEVVAWNIKMADMKR